MIQLKTLKIKKSELVQAISKKMEHSIHQFHILSVINIFIEEMLADLKSGKSIKVFNFGTFDLTTLKPKTVKSIYSGKTIIVEKTKALRFKLFRKISTIFSDLHFHK